MELHIIILFMIFASIMAVQIKDLISSVIALSAVGLGLSLAFLLLKAPNLAITQLVIEILCMVILIRGTIKKDLPLVRDGRWLFNTISTAFFIIVFLSFAYFALRELPVFGFAQMKTSAQCISSARESTGFLNITNSIALHYRSYDTLALVAIVFAATLGVLTITRKTGKIDEK